MAIGKILGMFLSNPRVLHLLNMVTRWQMCTWREALFLLYAWLTQSSISSCKKEKDTNNMTITTNRQHHQDVFVLGPSFCQGKGS